METGNLDREKEDDISSSNLDKIKTYKDSSSRFVQGVILVDEYGNPSASLQDIATTMSGMLKELKIMNVHLSMLTDNIVESSDI